MDADPCCSTRLQQACRGRLTIGVAGVAALRAAAVVNRPTVTSRAEQFTHFHQDDSQQPVEWSALKRLVTGRARLPRSS